MKMCSLFTNKSIYTSVRFWQKTLKMQKCGRERMFCHCVYVRACICCWCWAEGAPWLLPPALQGDSLADIQDQKQLWEVPKSDLETRLSLRISIKRTGMPGGFSEGWRSVWRPASREDPPFLFLLMIKECEPHNIRMYNSLQADAATLKVISWWIINLDDKDTFFYDCFSLNWPEQRTLD